MLKNYCGKDNRFLHGANELKCAVKSIVNPHLVIMARNLGHARAVDEARLSKSESHNASRLRDFTKKTDLKSRLPPFSSP